MKNTSKTSRRTKAAFAFSLTATMILAPAQTTGPDRANPNKTSTELRLPAAIPRPMPRQDRTRPDIPTTEEGSAIAVPTEARSVNGSGNNLENPEWGAAEVTFIRLFRNDYADGISKPNVEGRPSARAVSNGLVAQSESIENAQGATDYLWQWGQFIDHDIVETPTVDPAEAFDIAVPTGDPEFDPFNTGDAIIALNRSLYDEVEGVREQINAITSYLDASQVYGSDDQRAFGLRRLDGSGKLKVTESDHGDLLPYNTGGFDNAPASSSTFFLAGDIRANEQIALTAMHTLFLREHNHWAGRYAEMNSNAMDEEIYQFARMIVAAEIQAITYREFLPVLLGPNAIPEYRGYDPEVRADISNEFGAAAFRIGHSMLSPNLLRIDPEGNEVDAGHLSLAGAFFNPTLIEDEGIDSLLRGLAAQRCQELDVKIIDEVRNFLFGPPGAGGFDLASLNLQRGRDHGVPGYNATRRGLGLRPALLMSDITPDDDAIEALNALYTHPDQLDLWSTGLCEEDVPDSMVGETYQRILVDQFTRLRDGDRFYYESALPSEMVEMIQEQTLATIVRRNTDIGEELPDNVFSISGEAPRPAPAIRRPSQRNTRTDRAPGQATQRRR
ncbi:peroxidase family protein [Verrucomicrobiaceae bacterium 227]